MENNFYSWLSASARKHALTDWDWIAFIISVIALVIAVFTFKSQRKTQKNTTPVITMKIQKMLWLFLIKQFYYKMQYLHILQIQLQRCNYTKKPEESFVQSFCIVPESYIHEELFYDNKNYGDVNWLKKHITEYNMYFNAVANHLYQRNIKPENIERMFFFINDSCKHALKYYCGIFRSGFKCNDREFMKYLEDELFKKQSNIIKEQKDNGFKFGAYITKQEEYSRKDAFVEFFGQADNDFEIRYYSTTNRYMEYLLSDGKIVLEDE